MADLNEQPDPLKSDPLKAAAEAEAALGAPDHADLGPDRPEHPKSSPKDKRAAIVEALMTLAAERRWEEISISDVAAEARVTLSDFRDAFPSKGAVLGAYSRMIDKQVLDGTTNDLMAEPAKERLFDVLMRRLDAMAPRREALRAIVEWAKRDPVSAAALNQVALNSMRFMLEAADISSEGAVGAVKLQGLVLAWMRILDVWFDDDDPAYARTMAALDRELTRGETLVARVEDVNRLAAPLRTLARALFNRTRARRPTRSSGGWDDEGPLDPEERRTHTM
ncbi:MAG: TetR family transcriptional regulator [Hyphomicrobiales bacterium]|jgi:AcrR family transcriptional regulator|nr:TetR family transcriptional regulator [Hyphomicrobiales bacterium]